MELQGVGLNFPSPHRYTIFMTRTSGILLHITSLPGRFGVGDLGPEAYRFVDFLKETGQHFWQVLPLGPTGYGNSPYQCLSVFAGNTLMISPEQLLAEGYLAQEELNNVPAFAAQAVDYDGVTRYKAGLLDRSFALFEKSAPPAEKEEFAVFCQQNAWWLDTYALFQAVKGTQTGAPWNVWPEDIRQRQSEAIRTWCEEQASELRQHQYRQFQFFRQWHRLKEYCHQKGISIIGDMPIFVALDSAEVWAHPEMFFLDGQGRPIAVAGVPPDYFSETGQLWGNPLYRWEAMRRDGYGWWVARLRQLRLLVDVIRLDHFRGFEKYWAIPGGDKTALHGCWEPGPGRHFFETIRNSLGELPLIAEDLGIITPEVELLRDAFNLPGMHVLQFAFSGSPDKNPHLPHLYLPNCVVYTGTHDNSPTLGWARGEDLTSTTQSRQDREREVQRALRYAGSDGSAINWDFVRLAFNSVAETAIIPLQDVLGLGVEARMNTPSLNSGNWRWRYGAGQLTGEVMKRLRDMVYLSGRLQ